VVATGTTVATALADAFPALAVISVLPGGWPVIVPPATVAISGFAVAGTLRTFDTGFDAWPAVLLGVITAVGGGLIRDVMTGVQPAIFQRSELYAFAALGTSLTLVVLRALDLPRGMIILISIAVGIGLRLGSVRYGWTTWAPRWTT